MTRTLALFSLMAAAYAADVPQVLLDKCAGCHAIDTRMSGLNVTTRESLLQGGEHGPAIVPGKSAESRLYLMISGKIPPRMPLGGSQLPATDIEAIAAWIDAGAPALKTSAKAAPSSLPEIKPLVPVRPQIYDLAWSPDGHTIALAGFKKVRLIDPATKQQTAELPGAADAVRAVAFSRDGALLAAGADFRRGAAKFKSGM